MLHGVAEGDVASEAVEPLRVRPRLVGRTAWVLGAAIVAPLLLAASLGEEAAEREPIALDGARSVVAHPSGPWHGVMVFFSEIGAGAFPILVASLAVTVCLLRGMRRQALFVVLAVEG